MTTGALAAFAITLLVSLVLVVTARWHGQLSFDTTQGLQKFHRAPTPRIGGVALIAGLWSAEFAADSGVREILTPMLMAGLPAFAAGLLEDTTKRVGVLPRLLATMFSGFAAWYLSGIAMRNTGVPALDTLLTFTPLAVFFTMFAVGGLANAVNIIDGFNGLAAGAAAIMFTAMGVIALHVGDTPLAHTCGLLAMASLGFFAVNWPFGKIFLGDGGAYLLGFLLAWVAILLPMRNPAVTAWATLLACAYPVLEVAFSFWRKTRREGSSPGQPDRVHMHMLLHRRLVRPLLAGHDAAIQNGMTSPFAWLFVATGGAWAVVFAQTRFMLALGFILCALVYAMAYFRLSQFHWWPVSVHPGRRKSPGSRTRWPRALD